MSVAAGFGATAGVFAFAALILALSAIATPYERTGRTLSRWAGTFLGVAIASSITAIWLAVAGL